MNLVLSHALCAKKSGMRFDPHEEDYVISHALTADGFDASEDGTGRGTPLCVTPWDHATKRIHSEHGLAPTMVGSDGKGGQRTTHVESMAGVRRLTPTECERLQSFPDGWTCLCQPLETYKSSACKCPDGPRYRALGNAVTVNVIEWIGRHI